jgi:uncharacterized Zn finger protein
MKNIPILTEQGIRTFVGKQNFSQGQQSVHNGAIVSPAQQGMTLKAYCYGSIPEPYCVQVEFDDTSITTTLCSCSEDTTINRRHKCAHIAALLLSWYLQPEAFAQMDDLDTILERQSKTQLLILIKQLLQKQSEVAWQLTMPPRPGHKSIPVDIDEYRRQVGTAFQHAGHEWDAVYGISSDLSRINTTAAHFAQQRDYANAAAIYEVVARETLNYYRSYHDEDGALGRIVQECVEGLGACLENERGDKILRMQILSAIFTVHRFDVDHGGFGLTSDTPPEFLQSTTPEEKSQVAQWVHTALAEMQQNKQESEWRLKSYGSLLLTLEAEVLSDEEFLRIGYETKNIQKVVTRLLELGRVDEAILDTSQADGWLLTQLADLFVHYGQDIAIERIMYEKAQQERYLSATEWLKNHYLAKNNLTAALEMTELIFRRQPSLAKYQKIRELAIQLGTWEAVRQGTLTFLETTHNTSTQVEVALDEGNSERALYLLEAAKPLGPEKYQWKYDYARTPGGALKTAERTEKANPHASIDLYQQHVEHLIAGRGRSNYQVACQYLVKIRSLYEKLDETEQWINYLTWLSKRHSRLHTLKEEMAAIGLQ